MNIIHLILGSNQGDKLANINLANVKIADNIGQITLKSSIYETAPWGSSAQPYYFNQALKISSSLACFTLLKKIEEIEKNMGRKRKIKWGPRIIDIDILFFNQAIIHEKELTVPHPLIQYRRFVLVPLVEIDPHFIHPEKNTTLKKLLKECTDQSPVKKI